MSTQLAPATPGTTLASYFPTSEDWNTMLHIGTVAYKSGLLPTSIKSGEAAAIIALKARELGISMMMGFSEIFIVNGRPCQSAVLMQALARKNLPGLIINILESSDLVARVEITRPEKGSTPFVSMFAIADAERAKLLGKDVWKAYPAAMLWARAISAGLRKVCPETLMGVCYTPEELGASVDRDGNPITDKDGGIILEAASRPVSEQEAKEIQKKPEEAKTIKPIPGTFVPHQGDIENYRMKFGKFKDKTFSSVPIKDLCEYLFEVEKSNSKNPVVIEFINLCTDYTVAKIAPSPAPIVVSQQFMDAVDATPDPRDFIK